MEEDEEEVDDEDDKDEDEEDDSDDDIDDDDDVEMSNGFKDENKAWLKLAKKGKQLMVYITYSQLFIPPP